MTPPNDFIHGFLSGGMITVVMLSTALIFSGVMSTENNAAQQSVQLTALRRGLAVSFFVIVVLLSLLLYTNGGN